MISTTEMQSVYADPAYASVVKDLKAEVERLRARYQVPEDREPARPAAN